MSFVAIGGLICLLFVALSARRGVNIEEKCTKQYDLNFKLIGYNCEWSSARLFYYVGKDIAKITFEKLSKTSKVYIDGHVDLVAISEGDIGQCKQIISPAGIKILVNDEECGSHEMVMTSTTMTIAPIRVTKMESTPYSNLEPTETSTVQITPTKVMVHDTEITKTRMVWIYTSLVAVFVAASLVVFCCWYKRNSRENANHRACCCCMRKLQESEHSERSVTLFDLPVHQASWHEHEL